jgi:hypothetical protein
VWLTERSSDSNSGREQLASDRPPHVHFFPVCRKSLNLHIQYVGRHIIIPRY